MVCGAADSTPHGKGRFGARHEPFARTKRELHQQNRKQTHIAILERIFLHLCVFWDHAAGVFQHGGRVSGENGCACARDRPAAAGAGRAYFADRARSECGEAVCEGGLGAEAVERIYFSRMPEAAARKALGVIPKAR